MATAGGRTCIPETGKGRERSVAGMKNAVERLSQQLVKVLPGLEASLDRPRNPDGTWWLDLDFNNHSAVVEWRPGSGFGVSAPAGGEYGQKSDEVHHALEDARDRLIYLLQNRERTQAPHDQALRKLRESRRR